MRPDPVRLEVFHQLLAGICEEAGAVLQRSAASPNIRERRDFSVALFDARGRLVAQAAHIPVHLGSAADSLAAVRRRFALEPGDVVALNDPYQGGTHLPDVTLVRGVFVDGDAAPAFYVVDRAHHADIGGAVAGSMGVARDLYGEGLVLPPVRIRACGEPVEGVLDVIAANVRGFDERRIDLQAQEAALDVAARRVRELVAKHGRDVVDACAGHLMDASERIARSVVRTLPEGEWTAADVLDDDGAGNGPFTVRLRLAAGRGRLRFDWSASDDQAEGGINGNRSIAVAASVYVLRCLCPDRLPTNDGVFRVVDVVTRAGSLLDPHAPAPVAGGNVETSQRLVDVGFAALARAGAPVPACSAGTMSNLTFGGRGFQLYETLPGGAGAGPARPGESALQTHMTNTRNTPIEEIEQRWPLRVTELTVRRGSGGRGARRGGDGLVKEVELLAPATVSLFADRHRTGPPGAAGGAPGKPGRATVVTPDGRRRRLAAKATVDLPAGARIRIETPGGGGHGR